MAQETQQPVVAVHRPRRTGLNNGLYGAITHIATLSWPALMEVELRHKNLFLLQNRDNFTQMSHTSLQNSCYSWMVHHRSFRSFRMSEILEVSDIFSPRIHSSFLHAETQTTQRLIGSHHATLRSFPTDVQRPVHMLFYKTKVWSSPESLPGLIV